MRRISYTGGDIHSERREESTDEERIMERRKVVARKELD